VPAHREAEVTAHLDSVREKHWRIGEIIPGNRKVVFTRDAAGPVDWTAVAAS
jgi:hypothetical protein